MEVRRCCRGTMLFEGHFHTREQGQMQKNRVGRVELFDTSLRDGLQQPNLDISVPNAVGLLQRMGEFGVRYAEIGFAGANQFVGDLANALRCGGYGGDEAGAVRQNAGPRQQGAGVGRRADSWCNTKSAFRWLWWW